jgi:hypothetical protein
VQPLAAEITKAPASNTEDAVVLASRAAEGASPAGGVGMIYTAIETAPARASPADDRGSGFFPVRQFRRPPNSRRIIKNRLMKSR